MDYIQQCVDIFQLSARSLSPDADDRRSVAADRRELTEIEYNIIRELLLDGTKSLTVTE